MHYMALPVSFRWDEGFVARVDAARGQVSRSAFVRWAVEQALSETKGPTSGSRPTPVPSPRVEGVRSAAPAERPQTPDYIAEGGMVGPEAYRSSSFAKRDVRPVPKGKP